MEEQQVIGQGGEVKKFSEIYKGTLADIKGDRKEFHEVVDKELLINNFTLLTGDYGQFAVIEAELINSRELISFPVGSEVVTKQLKQIKEDGNLPIKTIITSRISEKTKRRYYTLS